MGTHNASRSVSIQSNIRKRSTQENKSSSYQSASRRKFCVVRRTLTTDALPAKQRVPKSLCSYKLRLSVFGQDHAQTKNPDPDHLKLDQGLATKSDDQIAGKANQPSA